MMSKWNILALLIISGVIADFASANTSICGPNFACQNVTGCIPSEWVCDHEPDCPDLSDETACNYYIRRPKRGLIPDISIFDHCMLPSDPRHGFYVIPDCKRLSDNVKLRCVKSKIGIALEGLVIEFYCKYGYELDGSHVSTCKKKEWDPPIPNCIKPRPTTTTTTTNKPTLPAITKRTTVITTVKIIGTEITTAKIIGTEITTAKIIGTETTTAQTPDLIPRVTELTPLNLTESDISTEYYDNNTETVTVLPTRIPVIKTQLSCPNDWELFEDYCYYISDFRATWQTARQACKQTDKGADLVSLRSSREQDYLTQKMFWQLWIGLERSDNESDWFWSDGTELDWENWGRDESSEEKKCVELVQSERWNSRDCSDKLNYICQLPSESPVCPEHWEFYMGSCYYVSNEKSSWTSARERCKQLHEDAELASIHGKLQQSYFAGKMYWQIWLGLNNLEHPTLWEWSDGTPTNFINWNEAEKSSLPTDQCADLRYTEKWTNLRCNQELKFACKMRPKDPCNEGWKFHEDACYYISDSKLSWEDSRETCKAIDKKSDLVSIHRSSEQEFLTGTMYWEVWIGLQHDTEKEMWVWTDGTPLNTSQWEVEPHGEEESCAAMLQSGKWQAQDCLKKAKYVCKFPPETPKCPEDWSLSQGFCYHISEERVTWETAKKKCKEIQSRSELVCLHSKQELRYITDHMFWRMWIGLNDIERKGQWDWSDDTPTNFISWKERSSHRSSEDKCAELLFSGSWNNIKCETKLNFACKVVSDPCPLGWQYLLGSCYYLSEFKAGWDDARRICKESDKNADLVSFRKPQENSFITRKLLRGTVWIGLEKETSGDWTWSDLTPTTFYNWHLNEPEEQDRPESCGALVHTGTDDNDAVKWSSLACSEKHYFACKMPGDLCDEGWTFLTGICYYLSDYEATWSVAREACSQKHKASDLLSIHSLEEQQLFAEKMTLRAWIGLKNNSRSWKWSDGSSLTFLNWNEGEPNNLDSEMCTELSHNGVWNNFPCSEQINFVCKISLDQTDNSVPESFPFQSDDLCPPIEKKEGTESMCLTGPEGDAINCNEWMPPGSQVNLQCSELYESETFVDTMNATCLENGVWSAHLDISCVSVCGKSGVLKPRATTLMHRGMKAVRGQWPWHAGLYKKDEKNVWQYHCGGSLLGNRYVITAAHCVVRNRNTAVVLQERRLKVFLGKYYRRLDENDNLVQSREVQAIYRHHGYNAGTIENDIAILVLKTPVTITNYVRPICYPKERRHSLLSAGKVGVVAGWGVNEANELPNDLYMATYPVAQDNECNRIFGIPRRLQGLTYCAGYRNGTGVCNGDSGGGMVFPASDNRWYLEGLVSYGLVIEDGITCDTQEYSVFTKVNRYLEWIAASLADADKDYY